MSKENEPVVDLSGNADRVDEVLDEAFGEDPKEAKPVEKPAEKTEVEKPAKEFKAPTSQEELDQLVQKRLDRERAKFKDYDDLKTKAEKLEALEAEKLGETEKATRRAEKAEKELADIRADITKRDRTDLVRDIGDELGLPAKLRTRVQGDDEKAIRADIAELLEGLPQPDKSAAAGPPSNAPKEKVKVSTGSGDADPEWSPDDIVKAIDRGGLSF